MLSILISFGSYGGIGDKYFCEEKENELGYEKAKLLFTWNYNLLQWKSIPSESYIEVSEDMPFVINKSNYFVASSPYEEGYSTYTFDGKTLVSLFVRNSHTYLKEYACTKL